MKKNRFTENQIVAALKESDTNRCAAKLKSALVVDIIQCQTTVADASRVPTH